MYQIGEFLTPQMCVEEVGHHRMGFFGLGQLLIIPEGMQQAFKNDQLGVLRIGGRT